MWDRVVSPIAPCLIGQCESSPDDSLGIQLPDGEFNAVLYHGPRLKLILQIPTQLILLRI